MFEDNIQEQQQKRVAQELEQDVTPVSPGHNSIDKEKDSHYHIEAVPKDT